MPTPSGTAALGTATFLADGGEMGRRIREFDWSATALGATALGAAAQWPASLKTVVRLMLTTNHAVFVFWGPDLIAQLLANLLGNAAKYTEPGGDIALHAREHDGRVEISVRDSGIGLAADDHDRIFSMFSQVDPAGGRARSGLGHGSTFTVRLPAPAH